MTIASDLLFLQHKVFHFLDSQKQWAQLSYHLEIFLIFYVKNTQCFLSKPKDVMMSMTNSHFGIVTYYLLDQSLTSFYNVTSFPLISLACHRGKKKKEKKKRSNSHSQRTLLCSTLSFPTNKLAFGSSRKAKASQEFVFC